MPVSSEEEARKIRKEAKLRIFCAVLQGSVATYKGDPVPDEVVAEALEITKAALPVLLAFMDE